MYSLNQEFPAGKGHVTFLKKRSELVVDEKTGKFFTLQEVESQVYFTGRDERPRTGQTSGSPRRRWRYRLPLRAAVLPRKISQERLRLRGLQNGCKTGGWLNGFRIRPTSTHEWHTLTASWSDPLLNIKIREEDFGGILYNPITDMVYKVNRPGFLLFTEIQEAYRNCMRDLRAFKSTNFRAEDVARFVEYLREQRIWEPR